MTNLKKLMHLKKFRFLIGGLLVLVVAIALISKQPALNLWTRTLGNSQLYGKIADTRQWYNKHGKDLVAHAKVTINSLPPKTTYTDEQGQFWFKGLRDISYSIKVELPYEHNHLYSFATRVNGVTGEFFDIANDEQHNLHEIDY